MKTLNLKISKDDEFSTKLFYFNVDQGAVKVFVKLISQDEKIPRNELKILIYDFCGKFRGWIDQRSQVLSISSKESSINGVEGYIPFGKWMMIVETGTIHRPSKYTIEIDLRSEKVREEWYVGELHSHTTRSDGSMDVKDLVEEAKRRKLDFIFVTDHDVPFNPNDEFITRKMKVFPGIEITTYRGHALALGIKEHIKPTMMIRNPELPSKMVKNAGGIFGIAHPFFPPSPYCSGCRWDYDLSPENIDFLELWNSGSVATLLPGFNLAALSLWVNLLNKGFKICATSGGDIHTRKDFSDLWLPFHVKSSDLSLEPIINSIKAGKAYAARGFFSFEVFYEDKKYSCGENINMSESDLVEVMVTSEFADKILLLSSEGAMEFNGRSLKKKVHIQDMKWLSALSLRQEVIVGFSNPVFFHHNEDDEKAL